MTVRPNRHDADPLRARDWMVRNCEHRTAIGFVQRIHYAKGTANTSVASHALVRRDDPYPIIGVALWMPAVKPAALTVSPEDWRGVLSLSRLCVAEGAPKNAASFLLGRSMALLDRSRWHTLLTYADTAQGHTGAIYRATNWTCLGEVPGTDTWVNADGKRRGRRATKVNLSARQMRELGYERVPEAPKIKFVHRAKCRRTGRPGPMQLGMFEVSA
jgi:hypothetical protein